MVCEYQKESKIIERAYVNKDKSTLVNIRVILNDVNNKYKKILSK